jgi:galactokinase
LFTLFLVYRATKHPIYENYRIKRFIEGISEVSASQNLVNSKIEELGKLMYESHDSYTACGMGSAHTDLLVELVKEAGPTSDLYLKNEK